MTKPAAAVSVGREEEIELPWMVADIGGTNARFALYPAGADPAQAPLAQARLATADFAGPAECAAAFLKQSSCAGVGAAALAIAAPLSGDEVAFTNARWRFSIEAVRRELGLARLAVINDFAALAHALPLLGPADRAPVGSERPAADDRPVLVIGPGTGLGAAAVIPDGRGGWIAVAGEGGHATAAARTGREAAVLAELRKGGEHVSYERVVSGPGLVELAGALAVLDGQPPPPGDPSEVVAAARRGEPTCSEAVALFSGLLATLVGDLALAFGAFGGVYLAGGVIKRLGDLFDPNAFRQRLEDKGRFRDYLAQVPVWHLRRPDAAFLGLRHYLAQSAY